MTLATISLVFLYLKYVYVQNYENANKETEEECVYFFISLHRSIGLR